MKTESTLEGTQRAVVLHPVPGEHLDSPIVHLHREVHYDLVGCSRQNLADVVVQFHQICGLVELHGYIIVNTSPFLPGYLFQTGRAVYIRGGRFHNYLLHVPCLTCVKGQIPRRFLSINFMFWPSHLTVKTDPLRFRNRSFGDDDTWLTILFIILAPPHSALGLWKLAGLLLLAVLTQPLERTRIFLSGTGPCG